MTKNALIAFSVGLDKSPFVNLRCLCNLNLYDQFFHPFLSKAILTLLFRRTQRISFERHLLYISFKRKYEVLMLRQVYEKPVNRCLWIWSQHVVAPLIWCYHFVFTVRKVMFLHLSVILSMGGVCLSAPPGTPRSRYLPGSRPPCAVHAERYSQQAGGMYPTGMQSYWIRKVMTAFSLGIKR